MAKKKAVKKKKQVARAKSAPKKTVQAAQIEPSDYVESDSNQISQAVDNSPGTDTQKLGQWDWKAWAMLGLAAAIILFSGWLVVRSMRVNESPDLKGTSTTPVPLEGAANPEQLQSGGNTNVQNGTPPEGENSSNGSGLQEQSPVTPDQLQKLQ